MDAAHLRHHLNELRSTLNWLRSLAPDGPRYKLWLGDLVEFTGVAFGRQSLEVERLRGVLANRARVPADADDADRRHDYLARLEALGALLRAFEAALPEVIPLIQIDDRAGGNGQHA